MASDPPRAHSRRASSRAPSALVAGSAAALYAPSLDPSPDWPGVRNYFRSISAMNEFQNLSAEELRLIDYTHSGSARAPYASARDTDGSAFQTLVAMPEYAFASPEEIRLADYWVREGGSHVKPAATLFSPGAKPVQPLGRDPFYAVETSMPVTETRAFPSAWGAAVKPVPKLKPQPTSKRSNALRDRFKQVDQLGRSPSMPITGPSRPRPVATGLSSSVSVQGIRLPRHADRGVAIGSAQPLSPVMQRSSRRMNLEPVSPFSTARAPTEPPPVAVVQVEPVALAEHPFLRIPPRAPVPRALFQPSPLAKLSSSPGSTPAGGVEPSSDTTSPSLPSVTSPTSRAAVPEGRSRLYRQLQAMCRKAEEFDEALDDLEEEQKLKSLCRKADEFNQALDRLTVNHALPKFQDKEESEPSISSTYLPAPHNTPTTMTGETTVSEVARQVETEEYDVGENVDVTSSVPHKEETEFSGGSTSSSVPVAPAASEAPSASVLKPLRSMDDPESIEGNTEAESDDLQFVQAASLTVGPAMPNPTAPSQQTDRVNPAHSVSSLRAAEINIQGSASRASPVASALEIEGVGDRRSIAVLSKAQIDIKGSGTSAVPLSEPSPVSPNRPAENVSDARSIASLTTAEINIEGRGTSADKPSTLLPVASPVAQSPEIASASDARSIVASTKLEVNTESSRPPGEGATASPHVESVPNAHPTEEPASAISHLENADKHVAKEVRQSISNSRVAASPSSYRYFLGLGLQGNSVEHYGNGSPAVAYAGRKTSRAPYTPRSGKSPRSSTVTFPKRASISSKASPPGGALAPHAVRKESPAKPLRRLASPVQLKADKNSRSRSMTISVSSENNVKRHHAQPIVNLSAFPLASSGKPGSSASEILQSVDSEKAEVSFCMGSSPAKASPRRSSGKSLHESPLANMPTNAREVFASQAEDTPNNMVSPNPFAEYVDKVVPKESILEKPFSQKVREDNHVVEEIVALPNSDDSVENEDVDRQSDERDVKEETSILPFTASGPLFPCIPENEPLTEFVDGEPGEDDDATLSTLAVVPPADANIDLSSDANSVGEEELILTELFGLEDSTAHREGAHSSFDRLASSPSPSPAVISRTAHVAPSPRVPVISMTQLDEHVLTNSMESITAAFEEDSDASEDELLSARESQATKNLTPESLVEEEKGDDGVGGEVLEAPKRTSGQIMDPILSAKGLGSQDGFEIVALQQLGFPSSIPADSDASKATSEHVGTTASTSAERNAALGNQASPNSLDQDLEEQEDMVEKPVTGAQTSPRQHVALEDGSAVTLLERIIEEPKELLEKPDAQREAGLPQEEQSVGCDELVHSNSLECIIQEPVKLPQINGKDGKSPEEEFSIDSESNSESQEPDDLSEEQDPLSQIANFGGSELVAEDDHRYLVEDISIHDFIPSSDGPIDTQSGHDDDPFFIVLSRDASENDSYVDAVSGGSFTLQNTYAAEIVVPDIEDHHDDGDIHAEGEGFTLDNAYASEIVVPVQEDAHDLGGSSEYDSNVQIEPGDNDIETAMKRQEPISSSRFVAIEGEKPSVHSDDVSEDGDDGSEGQEQSSLSRVQVSEDEGEDGGNVNYVSEDDDDERSLDMDADVSNVVHQGTSNEEKQVISEDNEQVIAEDTELVSIADSPSCVAHNVTPVQRHFDAADSGGNDKEKILAKVETETFVADHLSAASDLKSLQSRVDTEEDNHNMSVASSAATVVAPAGALEQYGRRNEVVAGNSPQPVSSPFADSFSPASEETGEYGLSRPGTRVAEGLARRVAMFSARSELGTLYQEYHGMASAEKNSTPEELPSVTHNVDVALPKVAPISDFDRAGEYQDEKKTVSSREATRITFADTEESVAKRHRSPPAISHLTSEKSVSSPEETDRTPPSQRLRPGLVISPGRPTQAPRFASVMRADATHSSRTRVATIQSGLASSIYPKNYVPEPSNELQSGRSAGAMDVTCVPKTPRTAPRPAIADTDITPEGDYREPHGIESWSEPSADQATEDISPSASMTTLPTPVAGRQSSLTRRHSVPPRTSQEFEAVGAADGLLAANSVDFSDDVSVGDSAADEVLMGQPSSEHAVRPQGPARGLRNHTMFGALAGMTEQLTRKNSDDLAPRASTDVGTGRKSMSAAISPTTAAVQHMIARETTLRSRQGPHEEVDRNGRANFLEGVKKLFSRVGRRRERPEGEPTRITRRLSLARGERRERESLASRPSVARRTKSEYRSPPKGRGRR